MLGIIIIQAYIFSLIESLDYGMPYPLWTYYLLQLIREKYIIFYGHIFYLTFNMITRVPFFMPM